MAQIIVPSFFKSIIGKSSVEILGNTVFDVIKNLTIEFPETTKFLLDTKGKIKKYINVFINNEIKNPLDNVVKNDIFIFIPSISGSSGGKGAVLRDAILDHVLGGPDYTRLSTVYIALYTSAPTSAGGGTEVSTSSTGYARQSVTNNTGSWSATSAGVKSNLNLIDFGTATGNWGTIVAGTIMSASSSGSILYFGPLTSSKTINTNDGFRIPIGGLVLTEA